jgi:hypothetical protein
MMENRSTKVTGCMNFVKKTEWAEERGGLETGSLGGNRNRRYQTAHVTLG